MVTDSKEKKAEVAPAVVIDLGKKKRKKVRQLRKGKGPLLGEVDEAIAELRADGTISEGAVPVIVVVRQKEKNPISGLTQWL
jgi:hypothetical protein